MATAAEKKREEARAEERRDIRSQNPGVWIPVDAGDTLEGVVTDVRLAHSDVQAQGGRSGDYPLLTVKEISEATGYELPNVLGLKVHGMPTVLLNELAAQQPAPGERVRITYLGLGEQKVKGRNAPALFEVICPDRDPKEVAANVYGQLRKKPAGSPQLGDNGGDPRQLAADSDIPFD